MHPTKERILKYEQKYGFNLQARRALNAAIRGGGTSPWQWVKNLFTWPWSSQEQTQHTHPASKTTSTQNTTRTHATPTQTIKPYSTPHITNSNTNIIKPFDTNVHNQRRKRPLHNTSIPLNKKPNPSSQTSSFKRTLLRQGPLVSPLLKKARLDVSKPAPPPSSSSTSKLALNNKQNPWYVGYCNQAAASRLMPYATLNQQIAFAEKLQLLDFNFQEHDHGGGGDCFLYAWIGSSQEQYGERDERLNQIFLSCRSHGMDIESKEAKMRCLRNVVSDVVERGLTNRRKGQNRELSVQDREIIKRIKTPGQWLQDIDIEKIAEYMNLNFFLFINLQRVWRVFGPARYDPKTTDVPTYYIINKGGIRNGIIGVHYMSLTKLSKGHFSCP